MSKFDFKCELCKQKKSCLYLNREDKKWYCKEHSPYFQKDKNTNKKTNAKSR